MKAVKGPAVFPRVVWRRGETGRLGDVWGRWFIVQRSGVGYALLSLVRLMMMVVMMVVLLLRMVAVCGYLLHLDGQLIPRVGHLVEAGRLHVVAGTVGVHKGAETGERGSDSYLCVSQVHAKLDKLRC